MRRTLFTLALTVAATTAAGAQQHDMAHHGPEADQKAVLAVVKSLFTAMKAGDSAAVRAAFHPRAQLASVGTRAGAPVVTFDSLAQFVRAIGTPHADAWDERTYDEMVHVDGGMAMVWAPYDFYAGTKYSHCGVDNFQFAKTADGWKIIALVDTRQRTGCKNQPK